jgi:hypothetical protein
VNKIGELKREWIETFRRLVDAERAVLSVPVSADEGPLDAQREACGCKIKYKLLRFEYTTLRIDERDALALENKTRLQLSRGQVIVHLAQPSHMLESRHANEHVAI